MCLCQQACKLPLTNHRDPFAPFRIAGRLRALEAMLRVKKSDNYSQMLPDEQVDFIAYYLVPLGRYDQAQSYLKTLHAAFINRDISFQNDTSTVI